MKHPLILSISFILAASQACEKDLLSEYSSATIDITFKKETIVIGEKNAEGDLLIIPPGTKDADKVLLTSGGLVVDQALANEFGLDWEQATLNDPIHVMGPDTVPEDKILASTLRIQTDGAPLTASSYALAYDVLVKGERRVGITTKPALVDGYLEVSLKGFGNYQMIRLGTEASPPQDQEKSKPGTPLSREQELAKKEFNLQKITPLIAHKNETITLEGEHITKEATLSYQGQSLSPESLASNSLTFTLKEGKGGFHKLYIAQFGTVKTIVLGYHGSQDAKPLSQIPQTEVCQEVSYQDEAGASVNGSKVCQGELKPCAKDGETGCWALAPFQAMNLKGAKEKLMTSTILGGHSGEVTAPDPAQVASQVSYGPKDAALVGQAVPPSHSPCTGAGQTACIATATFPAMDLSAKDQAAASDLNPSQFSTFLSSNALYEYWDQTGTRQTIAGDEDFLASHIKSGVEILSLTGTAIESPGDCSTDGEASCVTTSDFPAESTLGLGSKVISGEVVGGVTGNVSLPLEKNVLSPVTYGTPGSEKTGQLTLPDANLVREGVSYGIPGTPTTGQLVLPSETMVLSGSSNYGNPSSPKVPSYAPDYPAKEHVLNSDTVNYEAGTLTLPEEDYVLSGVSFGIDDALTGLLTLPAPEMVQADNGAYGEGGNLSTPTLAICDGPGAGPCVTDSSYPSLDASNLPSNLLSPTNANSLLTQAGSFSFWNQDGVLETVAGDADLNADNLKNSVTLFGETGTYPSPGNLLSDDTTTPDLTDFQNQIRSDDEFEFFDRTGQRYGGRGDSDLTADHIELGVQLENLSLTGTYGSFACPSNYLKVPEDVDYGTRPFCVMKYEALSGGTGHVHVNVDGDTRPDNTRGQNAARQACQALGTGYGLMSNDQWLALASLVVDDGRNWEYGSVGSGALSRGHSDGSPSQALPAPSDDHSTCYQTMNSCSGSAWHSQKRTFEWNDFDGVSQVIWDLSGNLGEYLNDNLFEGKPSDGGIFNIDNWDELGDVDSGFDYIAATDLIPSGKAFWNNNWNNFYQYIGLYEGGNDGGGGVFVRGGSYWEGLGSPTGLFTLTLTSGPEATPSNQGYRCIRNSILPP